MPPYASKNNQHLFRPMSQESSRPKELAGDLEVGIRIESKYTVRLVRVIPSPEPYNPGDVQAVGDLPGGKQGGLASGGRQGGHEGGWDKAAAMPSKKNNVS